MKNLSRIIAVLCLLAALSLSACAKAPAETPTEAAVTATQSPTQSPTETPATIAPTTAPSTDAPAQNTAAEHPTDSDPSPIALSGTRWNLSMVYADGEEQRPSVRYGSVIRQTGAYITFDSDNTFNCVLGLVGCTGTYSTSDSGTTLHITTRYDGTSENGESCERKRCCHHRPRDPCPLLHLQQRKARVHSRLNLTYIFIRHS